MLVFVLLRLPILIQSGSNLGQPRCASFENFTDFSRINKKTALICSIKTVFLLVLPKCLVAEVGFEPHDLRVMRCRRRRKLFPQAAFRCFSVRFSGKAKRSICFRVHQFHAVLFPYGSSYGSDICDADQSNFEMPFGSNEWVNNYTRSVQKLERI